MLKTGFIGQYNSFDRLICNWLSEHSDLTIIVWTNEMAWARGKGLVRAKNVLKRFHLRRKKKGLLRAADEFFYYVLYRRFLLRSEAKKLGKAVGAIQVHPQKPLSDIPQLRPATIKSSKLLCELKAMGLDALFAMCIDVYLPRALIQIPRYGSFLWHEGITPEYRGVYSPFWALANRNYEKLGYTLLKMNAKLDAGDIFVQGPVQDIDPIKDWHSYIGHKAILESLPKVKVFLRELEENRAKPIQRQDAIDGYYSYPTATALMKIAWNRWTHKDEVNTASLSSSRSAH